MPRCMDAWDWELNVQCGCHFLIIIFVHAGLSAWAWMSHELSGLNYCHNVGYATMEHLTLINLISLLRKQRLENHKRG